MSSSELIELKRKYINFKYVLNNVITKCDNALDKINGADNIIFDSYQTNNIPADRNKIKYIISDINNSKMLFNKTLNHVEYKISALNRKIDIAIDREMSEDIIN